MTARRFFTSIFSFLSLSFPLSARSFAYFKARFFFERPFSGARSRFFLLLFLFPLFFLFGRFRVDGGAVFARRVVDARTGNAKSASDDAGFYGRRDFLRRAGRDAKSESRRFAGNAAARLGIYFRFFGNF